MAGHRPWSELQPKLSPEAQARVEAEARRETMRLLVASLAKFSGEDQREIAQRLGLVAFEPLDLNDFDELPMSSLRQIIEESGGAIDVGMSIRLPQGRLNLNHRSTPNAA